MKPLRLVILCLALLMPHAAIAVQPEEMLSNPALEARARALSRELRCLVCQNQSIDDSEAPLAHDLRVLVRERLTAGDSDRQVLDFLVARYGQFILLRPRFAGPTLVLWLTPLAVLLIGAGAIVFAVRRQRAAPQLDSLSDAEEARVAELLRSTGE
jgi:cytochrome c-type biogenesis protein CcmH